MNRVEIVKRKLEKEVFQGSIDPHLLGVSYYAKILANMRKLDEEISEIAGLLHDIARFTNPGPKHAKKGAEYSKLFLEGILEEDKIELIYQMIKHHNKKEKIHSELDELLKDADVLDHIRRGWFLEKDIPRRKQLEGII